MLYRLFIYGSEDAARNASAAEMVKKQIEKELSEKCHATIKYPPETYDQVPFLYIATSYSIVQSILPRLYAIAAENAMTLYDAETNRKFSKDDLIDESLVNLKLREKTLKRVILDKLKPVWKYQELSFYENETYKSREYVVTISKIKGVSFAERTRQFYECLNDSLVDGEKLECDNKAFRISSELYSITFCLEAYKKQPNMIGYFEGKEPKTELIHRMGSVVAFKWMEGCTDIEKSDIVERMNFREMRERYKNPCDRFVKSVLIAKQLRKEIFDIRYSSIGYYGAEILFHIVPSDYYHDEDSISVLKI